MYLQKMGPIQKSILVLATVFIFTMAFSTEARAAVISLFSFGGVEVFFEDTTNELFAEGDEDAIKYESGEKIIIYGAETEELFIVWIDPESGEINHSVEELDQDKAKPPKDEAKKSEDQKDESKATKKDDNMVEVIELGSFFPDFQIPTHVPDGYTLKPVAKLVDQSFGLTWVHNTEKEILLYLWGESAHQYQKKFGLSNLNEPFTVLTFEITGKGSFEAAVLFGEIDSVPFMIYSSDSAITEGQLLEMVP